MRVIVLKNADEVAKWSAYQIAKKILKFKPTKEKPFVLGLPTGSTPLATYKELINLYNEKILSFENVVTFNMDEYVGLKPENPQSYHYFMNENFFKYIDIKKENINILNGCAEDLEKECEDYENKIKAVGGIQLFLGGVGEDGHIAFNEPGSSLMDSKEVMILANGYKKARAVYHGVEGGVNHLWTISALQLHKRAVLVIDEMAASDIKVKTYRYFKEIEAKNLNLEEYKKYLIELSK